MSRHLLAEERSIAMHRAIAARLRDDPRLLEHARERVRSWRGDRLVAAEYADAWEDELARGLESVCRLLVDTSERARALRQVTPFAGVLAARERWRIWRAITAPSEPDGRTPQPKS